ncbi:MAG: WD40 repeat domain-containing protein, partial [Planctomycetaceae bacterium]|nr:WD40 repeat domain-containing protein [Planctomycetaceae bacterium]
VAQRPESANAVAGELRKIATRFHPLPQHPGPALIPGGSGSGRARRGLGAWLTAVCAVAALLAIIIIKFQDGSTVELSTDKAVEGVTYQNPGQPAVEAVPDAALTEPASPVPPRTSSVAVHSLDHFDPQRIPESERVAVQPPELVAVLGEQAMREWVGMLGLAYDETGRNVLAVEQGRLPPHGWSTETFSPAAIFPPNDPGGEYPTFSRDGKHAFTVDRLWHAAEGPEASSRFARSESFPDVNPLCGDFSPDGRWLVTAADGASHLQLWDLTTDALRPIDVAPLLEGSLVQRQLTVVDSPPRIVISIFSGGAGTTEVYDVDWSALPTPSVGEPVRYPHKTYFARQAPRAVEMHIDGAVKVLDVSGDEPQLIVDLIPPRWAAGAGPVLGDISADGRLIVAPVAGTAPVFRDIDGQWQQTDTLQHAAAITAVRLSPDGAQLALAESDGYIQLWDISHVPATALRSASMATRIDRLTISPDGRYAGVAGMDGRAVYDLTCQPPRQVDGLTISGRHDGLWTFNVDPPLAGFTAGHVHDMRQTPAIPISRPLPVADVAFVPGRSELLLWNPPTGDVHLNWTPWHIDQRGTMLMDSVRDTTTIAPLFIDPPEIRWERGRFLATDSSTGMLRVYDFDHPDAPVATLQGRPFQNRWQCLSPSGELVLQWMVGQDAIVWDLTTIPPAEYRLPVHSTAGAFAPNEKYIILDGQDGGMVVYDWQLNREGHRIPLPGPVRTIHLHPDGRHVCTINGNGTVYVLRLPEQLRRPDSARP